MSYELRVGAGGSDVQVRLPLRIINFISLDPPVPLVDLEKLSRSNGVSATTEKGEVGSRANGKSPARQTLQHRVILPAPPPPKREDVDRTRPPTVHFTQGAPSARPAPTAVARVRTSDGRIIALHKRAASEQPPASMGLWPRDKGPTAPASASSSPVRLPSRPLRQPVLARPVTVHPAARPGLVPQRARVVSTTAIDPRARLSDSSDDDSGARAQLGTRMLSDWNERQARSHKRAPSAPSLQIVAPHRFFAGRMQTSPQRVAGMVSRSATSSPVKRPGWPGASIPRAQSAFLASAAAPAFATPSRASAPNGYAAQPRVQWKHPIGLSLRRANTEPLESSPVRQPSTAESSPVRQVLVTATRPSVEKGQSESDEEEDKYGSESSLSRSSGKSLYSQGRGSFSVPTLTRYSRQRTVPQMSQWSSSTSKELGFQSSASDSEDDRTPMNTIENCASRAISNRVSATLEFHAPLLREKGTGAEAGTAF